MPNSPTVNSAKNVASMITFSQTLMVNADGGTYLLLNKLAVRALVQEEGGLSSRPYCLAHYTERGKLWVWAKPFGSSQADLSSGLLLSG